MRLRWLLAALAAGAAVAWQSPAAFGADSIYWTTQGFSGGVRVGPIDGGGPASNLYTGESGLQGITIDAATGNAYWASNTASSIRAGDLNGTGASDFVAGQNAPTSVAVDSATGKIYWTDYAGGGAGMGSVWVANIDGTGSPTELYPNVTGPAGLAIDPQAGKMYWTEPGISAHTYIIAANLDGGGSPQPLFSGSNMGFGLTIDHAAGKIFWTQGSAIWSGNLNGTGAASLITGLQGPIGLAVDPTAGKLYWTELVAGTVDVGNENGTGSPSALFSQESPAFLALLRSPAGDGAPQVSGGATVGSTLSCTEGSWASDLPGSFLYRAPQSFAYRWTLNGADIAGATSSTYTAPAGGSYACRVTASNHAGSASQTSAAVAVVGGGTAPPTVGAPTLTGVRQSHRKWREGSALPHIASAKPPVGTTFRFTLNESARVRFAFTQSLPGRKVGRRCVAPTAKNRQKPKCTRAVTRGVLSFTGHDGANSVRFDGRISKHKKLAPGRYTLIITATSGPGPPATRKLTFTIVSGQ